MSVSYTGDATMDEPALRDIERWKDKIEVRLDNRQVFFLFFGSALCACMLFVLGVIVGKRLESRGRATAPEVQDPLAVLDRINSAGWGGGAASPKTEPSLTFPKALSAAPAKGRAAAAVLATPPSLTPPAPVAVVVAAKTLAPAPAKAAPLAAKVAPSTKPAVVGKASPPVTAKPPVAFLRPVAPVAPVAVAAPSPGTNPGAKGRFTLQLSSFPDRTEADNFAKRFASQGAFVVVSEIPGKGTWYRVRVGSYTSSQEAIAAKGTFEKQTNVIAYIAGR